MKPYSLAYAWFLEQIGQDTTGTPVDVQPDNGEPVGHVQKYLWCIDAGHDEAQDGKRSRLLPQPVTIYDKTYPEYREYIGNRDVAERLIELLAANGVAYMRTLPAGTRIGNGLTERVRNANNYPSLLPKRGVSIHSNAGPDNAWRTDFRGVEAWHYSTSVTGKAMAGVFLKYVHAAADKYARANGYRPIVNRGTKFKTAGEFAVLRNTDFTMIMIETLFFTNPEEVKLLSDPDFRQVIAEALFDAIWAIETSL